MHARYGTDTCCDQAALHCLSGARHRASLGILKCVAHEYKLEYLEVLAVCGYNVFDVR